MPLPHVLWPARLPAILPGLAAAAALAFAAVPAPAAAAGGDPLRDRQWALASGGPLGAPAAWAQSRGARIVVAVVDTGVDLGHPDLAGRLWTNPGEIPANGRDDDGDGYVDDVHGADVRARTGRPGDRHGHGTRVAGIVAAAQGNGIGGSGLAPRAQVMAVKALDDAGRGSLSDVAAGILYAIRHGARIVNVSVVGRGPSAPMARAVAAAGAAGATIVAAAGNAHRDPLAGRVLPASSPAPHVLGVAALTRSGRLLAASNRGRRVDIAAPGDRVWSTNAAGGYAVRSGTSVAAPFVSATIALLAARRPDLPSAALRRALLAGAHAAAGHLRPRSLSVTGALRRLPR